MAIWLRSSISGVKKRGSTSYDTESVQADGKWLAYHLKAPVPVDSDGGVDVFHGVERAMQ